MTGQGSKKRGAESPHAASHNTNREQNKTVYMYISDTKDDVIYVMFCKYHDSNCRCHKWSSRSTLGSGGGGGGGGGRGAGGREAGGGHRQRRQSIFHKERINPGEQVRMPGVQVDVSSEEHLYLRIHVSITLRVFDRSYYDAVKVNMITLRQDPQNRVFKR